MSETLLALQHIACEPPAAFEDELRSRGLDLVRAELDEGDALPDWREFAGLIVMGGPMGAYEEDAHPWLVDEKRAIGDAARAGHPVWGVCLGAQLLAGALGARVYPGDEAEVGLLPVELTDAAASDPVFGASPRSFPTLQWHGDTFELPEGATLLASSPAYTQPGVRLQARLRAPVPPRGVARAGRRVGRGARLRGEPRDDQGAGRARPAGRRGRRARRRDAAARAGAVRTLAGAGCPCPGPDHRVETSIMEHCQRLLDQETFEPPSEFRDKALIGDESEHEAAARDPEGWWAKQAEALDWFEPWDQVLDDSEAPFYKWFIGGKLNASLQRARPPRRGRRGDKVAFHWRGEEGEERDVTYADLLRDVKRLANVLKERGIEPGDVVGIFLPMIPEVAVAMLACARIGAPHNVVFGGFAPEAVRERMEFSEAKALITVDQARRKGKAADIKPAVDAFLGDVPTIETVVVVRNTGRRRRR